VNKMTMWYQKGSAFRKNMVAIAGLIWTFGPPALTPIIIAGIALDQDSKLSKILTPGANFTPALKKTRCLLAQRQQQPPTHQKPAQLVSPPHSALS